MVIASSITFFISIAYYLSKRASTFEKAKKEIRMLAEKSVLEVNNELSKNMGIVKGLKYNFLRTNLQSVAEKDQVINPFFNITLTENPSFLGTWYSMELSKYDQSWGNVPGRRRVSYYRDANGSINVKIDTLEIGGIKKLTGYHKVKEAKKDAIMEPYWCDYSLEGKEQFLETTLAVPVLKNNEFTGLVGVDLELKSFKNIVNKVKVLKQGYAFLVSNTGIYVTHPEDSLIGKLFSEVNPDEDKKYKITENIQKGNIVEFIASYEYTGEDIYALFVPLQVGETETPWSLGLIAKKSEIMKEANIDLRNSVISAFAGLLIMLFFIVLFTSRLTAPIKQGVSFAKSISEGYLSSELKITSTDEVGVLSESLKNMSARLRNIILQLQGSIQNLAAMSSTLSESSMEMSNKAGKQASASQNIIVSIEQVAANIKNNAMNARQTEKLAENSVDSIKSSENSSLQSIEAMKAISGKIGLITDIAFQTNILALNAAVESARAGEHGKGFAVVASEVRKLAERSRLAANEITKLVKQSVTTNELAGGQLAKVVPEIENILSLVKNITYASIEQDTGISIINSELNELDQITRTNANTAQILAQNAQDLNKLSDELSEMVKFFRI